MVEINEEHFLAIKSKQDLAKYLNIPLKQLTFFAYSGKKFYSSFSIPKKSGSSCRHISAPEQKLKYIQRILSDTFSKIYRPPDAVHGFVKERSISTNAHQHVGKRAIIKIDLSDFFPSISAKRVRGLLKSNPFNFTDEVADTLTNLVCNEGFLPQGAPTSPILSNMICLKMDHALLRYARKNRLKYTRYADDLTFSSTTKRGISSIVSFSDEGKTIICPEVLKIIRKNGFSVNDSKTGTFGRGTRQVVTGIVVNQKCNFRRDDYRYLRNLFHYWKHNNAEAAARRYVSTKNRNHYYSRFFSDENEFFEKKFIEHLYGLLNYYSMIAQENGRHSRPLQKLWTSLYDLTGISVHEMLPERMIFKTDSCANLRKIKHEDSEPYCCSGSCFLIEGSLILSARHCAKRPFDSDNARVEYLEDSFFEISEIIGIPKSKVNISYSEIKDGGALLDWLAFSRPKDFNQFPGLSKDLEYRVQVGEVVIAYGYADGKGQLRRIEAKVVDILRNEIIIVDRAFIKGMSGGPVLNTRGDVIGLITHGSGDGSYDRDGRFMPLKLISILTS